MGNILSAINCSKGEKDTTEEIIVISAKVPTEKTCQTNTAGTPVAAYSNPGQPIQIYEKTTKGLYDRYRPNSTSDYLTNSNATSPLTSGYSIFDESDYTNEKYQPDSTSDYLTNSNATSPVPSRNTNFDENDSAVISYSEPHSETYEEASIGKPQFLPNKETIQRCFSLLVNEVDPLIIVDELFVMNGVDETEMDRYKYIKSRHLRSRRYLFDLLIKANDTSQILLKVLQQTNHQFVIHEMCNEVKKKCIREDTSYHDKCALSIIKQVILVSEQTSYPVDVEKIALYFFERLLIKVVHYEYIISPQTLREQNERFIQCVYEINSNRSVLLTVFTEALIFEGYNDIQKYLPSVDSEFFENTCRICKSTWLNMVSTNIKTTDVRESSFSQDDWKKDFCVEVHRDLNSREHNVLIFKITEPGITNEDSSAVVEKLKECTHTFIDQGFEVKDVRCGCIQITVQLGKENNEKDPTSMFLKILFNDENFLQGLTGGKMLIKVYSCSRFPQDLNQHALRQKCLILKNFPLLIDEFDVLLFIDYFVREDVLSIEEFKVKFQIDRLPRQKRTSLFLNYILEADETCRKAFFQVLESSTNRYLLEEMVKEMDEIEFELISQSQNVQSKIGTSENEAFSSRNKIDRTTDRGRCFDTDSIDSSFHDDESIKKYTPRRSCQRNSLDTWGSLISVLSSQTIQEEDSEQYKVESSDYASETISENSDLNTATNINGNKGMEEHDSKPITSDTTTDVTENQSSKRRIPCERNQCSNRSTKEGKKALHTSTSRVTPKALIETETCTRHRRKALTVNTESNNIVKHPHVTDKKDTSCVIS